ncbi:MAG: DUF3618 domain-containing protein [Actinomycetota bacterium]|nr:DUF3618 domain-containing protein [Actinomycetota bacterium]
MSETASAPAAPTVEELESELADRRAHLSTTIDELITRVSPAEIARREVESVRLRIMAKTHTPDGELRSDLVAGALGVLSAVLIGSGLIRRYRD